METVRHDGRETAYRLAGEDGAVGDAVALYVHGSGATHRLWAAQYGPDGPLRPAAALDLSGHGDSADVTTDPGPATLDAYARDVIAVAEATGADALVGNSLGGAVVLRIALDTDFDPGALVLAGTGAKLGVDERLREWLADDFDRAVDVLHEPDRLFHDADERTLDRSREQMRATGQSVTRRDFLTCHAFDVRDRLDEIALPALAVVGEHDSLTPPSYHEFLADRLPDCEYVEIPDAAHLAMVERTGAFDRTVGRFLDSLDG
ncbi:alpha/beta fold hydrolase [Halosimplex litoreum]|uniref:Alpha/beta fold hydrolase n=1 Tax=Halosimplex litoreum TaxID=1198301 RepID=A0A7T3KV40_9EURY|nr:alpha/beta hydrolase [Halosimplex litoreum]QPV62593.1 alpha/beta fold hydrolase [Halosimplex litoreum]